MKTKSYILDSHMSVAATGKREALVLDAGATVELPLEVARMVDSGELTLDNGVFFARQLETIRATAFEVEYPELKARKVFPVTAEAGAGARTFTYRTYGQSGKAKIINGKANDLPRADIDGKENTIKIVTLGIEYGYDLDEIDHAQKAGVNLDQRRANAAQRGSELTINELAFYGDAATGIQGFFTVADIPVGTPVGITGTIASDSEFYGDWTNAAITPEQILQDLNRMFSYVWTTTNMVERANKLCVPVAVYNTFFNTPRSQNAASDTNIATYLVKNSQFLTSTDDIVPLNECSVPAGATGNASFDGVDCAFVFNDSAEKLQLHVPMELTYAAAQPRGLEVSVPGRSKCGGISYYKPKSALIVPMV